MILICLSLTWFINTLELAFPVGFALEGSELWVLDHIDHRLWVLDWTGKAEPGAPQPGAPQPGAPQQGTPMRSMGGPGEGPGELWLPDSFWFDHDDVAVFSRVTRSVSFFTKGGLFLRRDVTSYEGYPMGILGEQLLILGGGAGPGFDPARKLVHFRDVSRERFPPSFNPSRFYIQARGALQDFFFAWGPGESFFYADPFEEEKIFWVHPRKQRRIPLPIANPRVVAWDGKSHDLPEPYGLNTCWSHDRFHAPRPGFYFEVDGAPFLVATWIRGNGLANASYLFQVWDVAARTPVQWFEKAYFPIGLTFRHSILCLGEDDGGYFLLEIPVQAFLAGSWQEGEAAVSRLGL